ncbi:hypothetical protein Acr_20g0009350 [Actinidia rufa]|uniref:Uncharacterized protein n=1 Tax=Actinidia rufa TaxID=165716 RepID=A0A7J0GE89_9ERIC|nr:hypothetical protein Acr_20g0009350 [Actinidia rufa]
MITQHALELSGYAEWAVLDYDALRWDSGCVGQQLCWTALATQGCDCAGLRCTSLDSDGQWLRRECCIALSTWTVLHRLDGARDDWLCAVAQGGCSARPGGLDCAREWLDRAAMTAWAFVNACVRLCGYITTTERGCVAVVQTDVQDCASAA